MNFGTAEVQLVDGLTELSSFEVDFIKTERVFLAICFLAMLCLTIYNIYAYLWKGVMLKSYPLIFSYVLLTLFSFMGVFYEIFMGFRCGEQDCFTHLLVSVMPEYRLYFAKEKHKDYLVEISMLWKIRQQLLWGLGICQLLIITALALKIRHIEDYFDVNKEVAEIRKNIEKADKRAKWLYGILTPVYFMTALTLIILSFPIMNIVDQRDYNMSYLV